jgi:hypothetical protein
VFTSNKYAFEKIMHTLTAGFFCNLSKDYFICEIILLPLLWVKQKVKHFIWKKCSFNVKIKCWKFWVKDSCTAHMDSMKEGKSSNQV